MFTPTGLGKVIFAERYARTHEETWEEACKRVAYAVGAAETNGKAAEVTARFEEQLAEGRFSPGGRVWYGAGRPLQSLLNCLAGDTEILTEDGIGPIRNHVGPVRILANSCKNTGNGKWLDAEIRSFGFQKLWKLVIRRGKIIKEIFTTQEHQWIVASGKHRPYYKKETDKLQAGNILFRSRARSYRAQGVKPSVVGIQHGMWYGDGSRKETDRHDNSMRLCGKKDMEMLPLFGGYRIATPPSIAADGDILLYGGPNFFKEIPSITETASYLLGWLMGLFAADGCVDECGVAVLCSTDFASVKAYRDVCAALGIGTGSIHYQDRTSNLTGGPSRLYRLILDTNTLDQDFFLLSHHKARYIPNRKDFPRWKVVSAQPTEREEEVFCAVVPEYHNFTLADEILTGNCFVVPTGDSREQWGKTISDVIVVSGMGGGVGTNFSAVRGRNYPIRRMGGTATGAVSLMNMINKVGDELVSGGNRRMALMFCLDVNHPDVEEFLHAKLDLGQLTNANISVVIPPDYETKQFIKDVQEGNEIFLRFGGMNDTFDRKIKMDEFWKAIVKNAHHSGEPGVLNGNLANEMNNVWYSHPLVSTNPCGEIFLPNYGCCCLGAIVLPRFVKDHTLDWDMLDETVRVAVRFLDNVLTVNHYPLPEIQQMSERERRLGLGCMGLASMLMDLGLPYDSPESFALVDKLFNAIKTSAYHASVDIAIEKGPFQAYDKKMLESSFARSLKPAVRRRIKEYGIRNCALLTVAPTGTTSMVQGVTGGIEPLFAPVYIRRRQLKNGNAGERRVAETLVVSKDYIDHPQLAQGAYDIPVEHHFEMQKIVQKHVDNAVSKTVNIPHDFPVDKLSDIWLRYLPFVKGSTFYREGSRPGEPMQHVPLMEARKVIENWTGEKEIDDPESMECPSGVCQL